MLKLLMNINEVWKYIQITIKSKSSFTVLDQNQCLCFQIPSETLADLKKKSNNTSSVFLIPQPNFEWDDS